MGGLVAEREARGECERRKGGLRRETHAGGVGATATEEAAFPTGQPTEGPGAVGEFDRVDITRAFVLGRFFQEGTENGDAGGEHGDVVGGGRPDGETETVPGNIGAMSEVGCGERLKDGADRGENACCEGGDEGGSGWRRDLELENESQ